MGSASVSSAFLVILNIVQVVVGLALAAASIWFFVEIQSVTSLRNQNHYLLDYKVYWPQAIPWMFLFVGVFVLCVSCCGFVGVRKKSRGAVVVHVVFQVIALVLLVAAAIIALVFADSTSSDSFVADTVWDAFNNMVGNREVEAYFGLLERKFQCCGAGGPRDYKNRRPNRDFPSSCCDTYYHGWTGQYPLDCNDTDKTANERLGCAEVASLYTRIAIKVFAGAAIFAAIVGIFNLIVGLALSKSLKKKRQQKVIASHEMDSKKVLL